MLKDIIKVMYNEKLLNVLAFACLLKNTTGWLRLLHKTCCVFL